jgi:hypothetical protein
MSRETISLAQGQLRHDREIAAASRAVTILMRNAPQPSFSMFELTINPAAVGVLVQAGVWIRNNEYLDWSTAAPTYDEYYGAGAPPAYTSADVYALIDDAAAPTTLTVYYRPCLVAVSMFNPMPAADNRWIALGSYSIAGTGIVTIQAQYHSGLKQDWHY